MYKLELNTKEAAALVRILTAKAKEIHAWRVRLRSAVRDEEYHEVTNLLTKVSITKGGD